MRVLVNVTDGREGDDLIEAGLHREDSVSCSQCRCHYRVFSDDTFSVEVAAALASSIEDSIAKSHPNHPKRFHL